MIFLQSRRPVGVAIRCRDVGGHPPAWDGSWGFIGSGGASSDGEAPAAEARWELELHLGFGGKSRGGVFEPMETYIRQRHNTVAQYISTQSLLDLCEATERKQGARVGMW